MFRQGVVERTESWVEGDGAVARDLLSRYVHMFPSARVDYFYAEKDGGTRVERKAAQGWNRDQAGLSHEMAEFDATAERIEFHRPAYG